MLMMFGAAWLLATGPAGAGGKEKGALSDEQFQRFAKFDGEFLQTTLADAANGTKPDKLVERKIKNAALLLAAYAERSAAKDAKAISQTALGVYWAATGGDWKTAKEYADALPPRGQGFKGELRLKKDDPPRRQYMWFFSGGGAGGFNVEAELDDFDDQKDKYTDAQFARMAELGTKIAIIGHAIDRYVPEKDEKMATRKNWLLFTAELRENSQQLASAAAAKNEAGTRQALERLGKTCIKCHDVFK
jgi:hypothetical protein